MPKCDELFKFNNEFGYLGVKDCPHDFLTRNVLIDVDFHGNRIVEITAEAYIICITEIISRSHQLGSRVLLILNNYVI